MTGEVKNEALCQKLRNIPLRLRSMQTYSVNIQFTVTLSCLLSAIKRNVMIAETRKMDQEQRGNKQQQTTDMIEDLDFL